MARPLPRVFGLLAREKDPAVDLALIEALPHLKDDAQEAALSLVCERGRAGPIAQLLTSWNTYEPSLREAIQQRFDQLHPGVRALLQSEKFEQRAAAIAAVVAAHDCKSAYLLAEVLGSRCPRTRELAAQGLRSMTEAHLARRDGGVEPERAGEFLVCDDRLGVALRAAIKSWEAHLHMGVLEAGLWLIEHIEETLAQKLESLPSKIGHALEAFLKRAHDPRLAGFFLRALTFPSLRQGALKALAQVSDPKFLEAIARGSWLLGDPKLEKALHGVHFGGSAQGFFSISERNPAPVAGAMRMLWLGNKHRDQICDLVDRMDDTTKAHWGRALLWQLVADESDQSTAALAAIASRSGDPRSAIAVREHKRRQARSAPAGGGRREMKSSLSRALEQFIEEHDRLAPQEFTELADQLETLAREATKQLAQWLESPIYYQKARTIRAIEALRWAEKLLPQLHRCAHDADPMVRSAALRALARDKSPTTLRVLREGLSDPEPRVQAMAIEALEQLGVPGALPPIRLKLQSSHHRVRANAIKALWSVELRNAAAELEKMLNDQSPEHRASALWVAERIKFQPILERIAAMGRIDPDARVRMRASRVIAHLDARLTRDEARHAR